MVDTVRAVVMVEPGKVSIVDASLAPQGVRRSVVSYLAQELLSGRVNKKNEFEGKSVDHELLFVVEEAHNYASTKVVHSCRRQLSRLASEGREVFTMVSREGSEAKKEGNDCMFLVCSEKCENDLKAVLEKEIASGSLFEALRGG